MSQTISAIASLLWPLIVLAVLVLFRGPLTRVIRSTERRDFAIKIAGQEVSVGELHRQQMDMMADLTEQVAGLRKDVDSLLRSTSPAKLGSANRVPKDVPVGVGGGFNGTSAFGGGAENTTVPDELDNDTELTDVEESGTARHQMTADMVKAPWERLEVAAAEDKDDAESTPAEQPSAATPGLSVVPATSDDAPGKAAVPRPDTRPKPAGVLWVDDKPARNALQLDQLERRGIVVDTARSTREAIQKLTGQRYQIIVSDMERVEGGKPVANAGLELIRTVRTFDRETPVVIYSSDPSGRALGDTATQIGADLVTGSWYQLSQELRRIGVL